jgi:F-type H+-transporting ATPase subunit b
MAATSATGLVVAAARLLQEGSEHAEKFLGLPLWLWQLVNLALFIGVLLYFVARPMTAAFRKRQLEVEERRRQAENHRAEVQRLTREIEERTARLEREVVEIRRQGAVEGESARAALAERATAEAERVLAEAREEIERRLVSAKAQLRETAAHLTAETAGELLSREITDADRRRLLEESVARVKSTR